MLACACVYPAYILPGVIHAGGCISLGQRSSELRLVLRVANCVRRWYMATCWENGLWWHGDLYERLPMVCFYTTCIPGTDSKYDRQRRESPTGSLPLVCQDSARQATRQNQTHHVYA